VLFVHSQEPDESLIQMVAGAPNRLVELPKLPGVTDPHLSRLRLHHKPVAVGAETAVHHIDRVMDFHANLLNRFCLPKELRSMLSHDALDLAEREA